MKFHAIRVHQLGCFSDVSVDLAALPQLVAVCGSNGSGKSSLLELLTSGAIWRECPTRGALPDLARARDSFVEVDVEHGERFTIRQGVDAITRKGETLILDAAGQPVVASGKIADAKAWVASHFPSREVLFASTVALQGGGGNFLGLTSGERKAVILRALGIEAIEQKAEAARERYRAAKAELQTLAARVADERARGGDLDGARTVLAQAEQDHREAAARVETARSELARAEQDLEQVRKRNATIEAALARVAEIEARITSIMREHTALEERIRNNRQVIADAGSIRAAVARLSALRGEMEATGRARAALESTIAAGEERARAHERAAAMHTDAADADARRAKTRRVDARTIEERREAAARLGEQRSTLEAKQAIRQAASSAQDSHRAWTLRAADERIGGLRDGLQKIADGLGGAASAAATLGIDDAAAVRAAEAPARLRELDDALALAMVEERDAETELRRLQSLAAQLPDMERALLEAATHDAAAEQSRAAARLEAERATAERAALSKARARLLEHDAQARSQAAELHVLESRARLLGPLEAAEGRLAEYLPRLDALAEQARQLRAEGRAAAPAPGDELLDEVPFQAARGTAQRAIQQAEEAARSAISCAARARVQLEAAEASAARLVEMETARVQLEQRVADWSLLADSLGRDGLQAHLVDAAGPELTALANDLLHRAFGPRFTVSITTTRPRADGKGEREVFDVTVLDVERGRDGSVDGLSGGERVIVGEAISLAIAMLVARRHGLGGADLIRDESGAALDPENGRRWVSMLRRAAELAGAQRVFFVSHQADLADLADARLIVADGSVRVEAS